MSKYLFGCDRFKCHISIANIKWDYGVMARFARDGSDYLMTWRVVLMVLRLRVSRIMLANPIKIVTIIPIEIMPPVRVRYSD